MRLKALSLALAVMAIGCHRTPSEPSVGIGGLRPTQQVQMPELTLTFVEVKSDSRCPLSVVCVWSGNATVVVAVQAPFTRYLAMPIDLNTDVEPRSLEFGGVTIRLDSLTPYPATPASIPQDQYVAYFSAVRR